MSRIPPVSPAATMLVYSGSNTRGCLAIASASVIPASTSDARLKDYLLKIFVVLLLAEYLKTLDKRQTRIEHD